MQRRLQCSSYARSCQNDQTCPPGATKSPTSLAARHCRRNKEDRADGDSPRSRDCAVRRHCATRVTLLRVAARSHHRRGRDRLQNVVPAVLAFAGRFTDTSTQRHSRVRARVLCAISNCWSTCLLMETAWWTRSSKVCRSTAV